MIRSVAFPRVPAPVQDVLLAVFVTVMQVQGTYRVSGTSEVVSRPLADFGHLGLVLLVLSGAVLAARRRWPAVVFVVTASISLTYFAIGFPDGPGWLSLFIAIYTLTAYGDGRRSLRIAAGGIAVLATGWLVAAADIEPEAAIGWVFFRIGASIMAAALGESIRSRRVIAAEAVDRAERAERGREEEAVRRVNAERIRIAREVHDTVAHAIAIINVQAGVTAHVLDKRPERVRETLLTIEQTSAQALQEMRAVLGVLCDADDARAPKPGLDQVEALTAMARESGLDLKLEMTSPPVPLPSAVDSAAYRILQESVTNVIRHAGGARVTISVRFDEESLELRVTDNGPGAGDWPGGGVRHNQPDGLSTTGRGIIGMRQRCELLGGHLDVGPRPGGGFEVRASLPLTGTGMNAGAESVTQ
ncbi:sensor histidine kinase [Phytoactinopolyspora mesophila]|uniref:histidine kinase n=1 Tax=Phytoactinopolyspora mesophila TaxID=2650750 RepID=A0A7K3M754_9ACTN|nr:sensor histidine kinase [Phytoactinopolyspora mesophila]NDL59105.1 sensor histidine kinase [Phytoactinopolyspora mesophila]